MQREKESRIELKLKIILKKQIDEYFSLACLNWKTCKYNYENITFHISIFQNFCPILLT